MITGSKPTASKTRTAPGTESASPPAWPRVATERMNTSSPAMPSMRTRSPRMAPPLSGDDGSTASTAGVRPRSGKSRVSWPVSVDFPAPGAPVMPTTWALPMWGWVRSVMASAVGPPRSTSVSKRPMARRLPERAASTSSEGGRERMLTLRLQRPRLEQQRRPLRREHQDQGWQPHRLLREWARRWQGRCHR